MTAKKANTGGDYEVGKYKPPKEHRFRKGTSGNPSGRPKRPRLYLDEVVQADFHEKVRVKIDGKFVWRTRAELFARRCSNWMLSGSSLDAKRALEMYEKLRNLRIVPPGAASLEERDAIGALLEEMDRHPPPDDQEWPT